MTSDLNHTGAREPEPRAGEREAPRGTQRMELKISSHPANLRMVRKQVESFAHATGMSTEASDAVGLALNEAMANVIRHGYGGAYDKPIVVTAEAGDGEVRLTIRDWGKRFDPTRLPCGPEIPLKPGGLGLVCIRKLMDEVKFEPLPDGMLLSMVKKTAKQ